MSRFALAGLPERWRLDQAIGIASVCSAHALVIEASFTAARHETVLIEATCNQVNQEGGYTGMTPVNFRRFVEEIRPCSRVRSWTASPRGRPSRS
jgi:D-tagatose 6-phosphate 4-epimerase